MAKPNDVVRAPYARVARRYDRRWSAYIDETLAPTLEALSPVPGERLLDVGCGTGALLERIRARCPEARLAGADLSPEMLAVARGRLPPSAALACADAAGLPFADGAFRQVVTSSSLHHWPDPAGVLREIARVLEPGGRLVVTDWSAVSLAARLRARLFLLLDRSVAHVHTPESLRALLSAAGLRPVAHHAFHAAGGWEMMCVTATKPHPPAPAAPAPRVR